MKNKLVGNIVKIGVLVMSASVVQAMQKTKVKHIARTAADRVCPWVVGLGATGAVVEAAGTVFASDDALNQPVDRKFSISMAAVYGTMAACATHYATRNTSTKQ